MNKTKNDDMLAFAVMPGTPKIRFIASLSDGRTIIQDNRSGQKHAWARLASWLEINKEIFITELRIQGPNGIDIKMPPNQTGYFFGQKKNAVWGGGQYDYIGLGYYDGQNVKICWYKQPLFDHSFAEERTVEKSGFFLIQKT